MSNADALLDEELALEHELALERARTSLLGFITYMDPTFEVNWHHRLMCEEMDRLVSGENLRLLVSMPPRHGKSQVISRNFPAYILGRNPDHRIIACAYGDSLASQFNRDVQRIIEKAEYREVFPRTQLNERNVRTQASGGALRNSDFFECVGYRGYYRSAGVGGSITGMGADFLLLDDALRNAEQANSPTILAKQIEWYGTTFRTRAAKGARIVGCQTRWHSQDIFGQLIELQNSDPGADQFKVINLPAINENGPTDVDPRGVGQPLWPSFFPLTELSKLKQGLGSRAFSALYQGQPTPGEGGIVKRDWWRYYMSVPQDIERIFISADLTFKDSSKGDFCSWQIWGKRKQEAYLLDEVYARQDFNAQMRCAEALAAQWPSYHEMLVEDTANGPALIAALRSRVPRIIPIQVKGSKQARAEAQSPLIEAGNVYLPHRTLAPWADDYVQEWTVFPASLRDDRVDSGSQALCRMFPPRGRTTWAKPVSFTKTNQYGL